ncbi:MAG: efflux RND transporter periplasmic adaptor subunit [Oleiphilaceae bacterium]|nr:efflux RND transporter periplasmic adaptor subunit [Oleiphilaceae bacterium]
MVAVKTGAARLMPGPRFTLLALLLLLAAVVAGLYFKAPELRVQPGNAATPEVAVVLAEPGTVSLTLDSHGRARPRDRVQLAMKASGEVVEVAESFRNGGWVEKGEKLLQLDPQPFELEVRQREHQLASARLHLETVRANAVMARRDASPRATDFALFKPQLAEAEAGVEAAESALAMARRQLGNATLRAPFSGRLKEVRVSPGQNLAAGDPVGQIYSAERMEVRLPVRDDWLGLIGALSAQGNEPLNIPVTLKGRFGGRERLWQARVSRREGGLSRNQMTWLVAEVDPGSADLTLEPGVYVEAAIQGQPRENIVRLPREALIQEDSVWVVHQGQLQKRRVEWIYRDAGTLYVSAGLAEGEAVLANGHAHLLEGARVTTRIVPAPSRAEPAMSAEADGVLPEGAGL